MLRPLGHRSANVATEMEPCLRGLQRTKHETASPYCSSTFHALWEVCNEPDSAPRPAGAPTRIGLEVAFREEPLRQHPIGTVVGREFADSEGNPKRFRWKFCDFCDPYWRVEYTDGEWEEYTKRALLSGIGLANRPPTPST